MTVGQLTISGNVQGAPSGARSINATTALNSAVDQTLVSSLSSGNNTVTVPTGATVCVIFPPNASNPIPNPSYAGVVTLKGVAGDTGVAISNKYPTVLQWDAAPSSFVVNVTVTGSFEFWFA